MQENLNCEEKGQNYQINTHNYIYLFNIPWQK